jgi:hypothetical protein
MKEKSYNERNEIYTKSAIHSQRIFANEKEELHELRQGVIPSG